LFKIVLYFGNFKNWRKKSQKGEGVGVGGEGDTKINPEYVLDEKS